MFLSLLFVNLLFPKQLASNKTLWGYWEPSPTRALVVTQHLNPEVQHQPCGCCAKTMLAPEAVLCLHPSALVLIIFTERVGCSYPTYLVSLKTNKTTLALDIPLALITVTTPHSGWRPGEILSGKFCFPISFIVSAWLGNQVALAEGKFLHTPPFLFLVCVDVAPPHSPPSWSPGRCREVLATGVSVWVAWHPSLGKGRKSLPGWQAQASPSKCPLKCLWQVPELVSHSSQPRRFQERNLDLLSNPWASTTFVKNKYLRWTFLSGSHKQIPSGHNLFHR